MSSSRRNAAAARRANPKGGYPAPYELDGRECVVLGGFLRMVAGVLREDVGVLRPLSETRAGWIAEAETWAQLLDPRPDPEPAEGRAAS